MATLEAALEAAIAGNGQVVGVVAEAGTGKSRLCLEFVERCRARGVRVNEAHCPAHGKTIPFLPLLEMLRDIFGIEARDSDHEARRKIAGELMLLDESFQTLLPILFDFLGVADPAKPGAADEPGRPPAEALRVRAPPRAGAQPARAGRTAARRSALDRPGQRRVPRALGRGGCADAHAVAGELPARVRAPRG